MKFYRLLLIIPLMILLGCNDYSLQDPFIGPNGLYGYKDGDGKIREIISELMSREQIAQAQELAQNWKINITSTS